MWRWWRELPTVSYLCGCWIKLWPLLCTDRGWSLHINSLYFSCYESCTCHLGERKFHETYSKTRRSLSGFLFENCSLCRIFLFSAFSLTYYSFTLFPFLVYIFLFPQNSYTPWIFRLFLKCKFTLQLFDCFLFLLYVSILIFSEDFFSLCNPVPNWVIKMSFTIKK